MATQTTNITFGKTDFRARISAFFAGIGRGMEAYMESKSRLDQVQALEAKSDDELRAMGLSRENITRHVFRDMFYV